MRRFWIDRSCQEGEEFVLKDMLHHHVCRVCCLKKGEVFELFAEGVQKYIVELKEVSSSKARARILKTEPVPLLKKPYLHLALSIPRLNKMDFILEKAVELGVKCIHPFFSDFSHIKKQNSVLDNKRKRWETLQQMASAVSGRTEPLSIFAPCFFKDMAWPQSALALMAYEGERTLGLKEALNSKVKDDLESVWIFIGSEGGFSEDEADIFLKKEGRVFSLGDQILRVETACLMSLSILKYHYHLEGFVK